MEWKARRPYGWEEVVNPSECTDLYGREFPDYNVDGIGVLHALLGQVEAALKENLPGALWDKTGYAIRSLDDLLRAVNSYEMSYTYRSRLAWAIHGTELYDSYRADIRCKPSDITAKSDLAELLAENKSLVSEQTLIHNDLLRADLYEAFARKFDPLPTLENKKIEDDMPEGELKAASQLGMELHQLHQQTTFCLLKADLRTLHNWLEKLVDSHWRRERPRRAYKEPQSSNQPGQYLSFGGLQPLDSRRPRRAADLEHYLPTPILIARQWIWEHYLEAAEPYTQQEALGLSACRSIQPQLTEQAHATLIEQGQLMPTPGFTESNGASERLRIEHIEEVYRRLDPFEPTFGKVTEITSQFSNLYLE